MNTWSYTIMGNSEAGRIWFKFSGLIWSFLTDEEIETLKSIPHERIRLIIKENIDNLVKIAIGLKSRLVYQVLGVFLMEFGAKMTSALKELILIHSRWEDERNQLFDEKDRAERFYYLSKFRKTIKSYKNGVRTIVSDETPSNVVEKLRLQGLIDTNYPFIIPLSRPPIDHKISALPKIPSNER